MRRHGVGFELDWLAVDAAGHVALLSSGGYGPVPAAVVKHLGEIDAALERVAAMPVRGECAEAPTGAGNYAFWVQPARRGLFGFDWDPVSSGPFTRLTTPSRPVMMADVVDPDVKSAAGLVRLTVDFAAAKYINANQIGELDDGEPAS